MQVLYSTEKPLKILILHKQKNQKICFPPGYQNQRITDITMFMFHRWNCSLPYALHITLVLQLIDELSCLALDHTYTQTHKQKSRI